MSRNVNWVFAAALVVAMAAGTGLGFFLQRGPQFGFVDPTRVWANSELGQQLRQQVAAKEQELNERFSKLTNEQKAQRRDEFIAERNKLEADLVGKFQSRMNEAVQQLGKELRLDAVFSQAVMPYGTRDLTAEVTAALKKE